MALSKPLSGKAIAPKPLSRDLGAREKGGDRPVDDGLSEGTRAQVVELATEGGGPCIPQEDVTGSGQCQIISSMMTEPPSQKSMLR
jgi:hypothetical protein